MPFDWEGWDREQTALRTERRKAQDAADAEALKPLGPDATEEQLAAQWAALQRQDRARRQASSDAYFAAQVQREQDQARADAARDAAVARERARAFGTAIDD